MTRKILLFGLLFFLTSCELIIIDRIFREEHSLFTADYWEEKIDSWFGFYEESDDISTDSTEQITELDITSQTVREINFPEQLINTHISSSCNNYEGFLKDAMYFRLIEEENSSFVMITRLVDPGYYGIAEKVFKDIETGEIIIETPVYEVETEGSEPIQNSKLIIKGPFGQLTITQTFPFETIDFNGNGLLDENEKIELTEEGYLVDENDKEISRILVESGSVCTTIPSKPKSRPNQSKPRVLDSDNDGIQDSVDNCPNVYGSISGGGCPDKDGDGIIDSKDRCPSKFGSQNFSGCPDSDGDGIPDYNDDCSYEPGSINNKGCPEPEAPVQTEVVFGVVEKIPEFPSCANRFNNNSKRKECFNDQLNKILKKIKYPKDAKEMGITGRVFFQFLVDDEGNIKNIKTFSRTGKDVRILRNEVYRVLEKLPKMVPGKNKGKNVSVPISRYIDFKKDGRKYTVSWPTEN